MKKRITTLLFLMLLVLMTSCADSQSAQEDVTGGKQETEDNGQLSQEHRSNIKEVDKETGESYWLLADFEDYYECTQVKWQGAFGKIHQIKKSKESDKVTHGDQSVKLEILGTEETFYHRSPIAWIGTSSGFFDATVDFTGMSRLTFDIYNAMDYEVDIRFYVDTRLSVDTLENLTWVSEHYPYNIVNRITLTPGKWNHIEIPADQMKSISYDEEGKPITAYGEKTLKTVGAFCLMFDRGELHDQQQVFYLDNIRAYLKDADNDGVQKELPKVVISDHEKNAERDPGGFYLNTDVEDNLNYSNNWDKRYRFWEGGVYLNDELLDSVTLIKVGKQEYYVALGDAKKAEDGDKVRIDGVLGDAVTKVKFESAVFEYSKAAGGWKMLDSKE